MKAASVSFVPPPSNPFATRFTRPGRLTPLGEDGQPLDLDALLLRLAGLGGRGAIEGPHGSGKTTLLTALAARIADQGGDVRLVRVRTASDAIGLVRGPRTGMLCIDGWERIPWPVARAVRWWTSRRGSGLIVTAHRPTGLPLLHRSRPTVVVLTRIVERLPDHGGRIGTADIAAAFSRHVGDLREALYDLYDRFERRIG